LEFADRSGSRLKGQVPIADEVLVADRRPGALGQRHVLVEGEGHVDGPVLVQGHRGDLADLDPRDAHEVAAFEAGGVAEQRVVGGPRVEPELAEHGH